jgi:hypothetical protein
MFTTRADVRIVGVVPLLLIVTVRISCSFLRYKQN